jgi:hypothetical protein
LKIGDRIVNRELDAVVLWSVELMILNSVGFPLALYAFHHLIEDIPNDNRLEIASETM